MPRAVYVHQFPSDTMVLFKCKAFRALVPNMAAFAEAGTLKQHMSGCDMGQST